MLSCGGGEDPGYQDQAPKYLTYKIDAVGLYLVLAAPSQYSGPANLPLWKAHSFTRGFGQVRT